MRINKINANKQLFQAEVTITEISSTEVAPNMPYKYFEIETFKISSEDLNMANLEFKVSKEWINENEIAPSSITLYRYDGGWNRLKTVIVNDDSEYYYYEAETDNFSIFAISGQQGVDFWTIFDMIKQYYENLIDFTDVVDAIDLYYGK